MKQLMNLSLAAFAIVAVASCAKEMATADKSPVELGKKAITIEAGFENVKATLATDLSFVWSTTDSVAVYDGTIINKFTVASCSGNTATLQGSVTESATDLIVVYPFTAASIAGSALKVTMSKTQTIPDGGNIDPAALVCIDTTKVGKGANLSQIGSLVKFGAVDGSTKFALRNSDYSAVVTVNAEAATGFSAGTSYYATIAPATFENGIIAALKKDNVIYGKSSAKAADFQAGKGMNLGVIDSEIIPATILNSEQLTCFQNLADLYDTGDTVCLGADLECTAGGSQSFAGTFNGQNHTITLNIEKNERYLAFIRTVTGTVKNLKTAGSIKSIYNGADEYALAPMVATLDGGLIDGCTNSANVTDAGACSTTTKYANVGGVVAYVKGDGAAVKNCSNSGKIKITNASPTIAGGVVAYGQTNTSAPTLTFAQLGNTGDLEANHTGGNWDYLGGVIGKMGASSNPFKKFYIKNCSNWGKLTITKAPKLRGGGVFGSCGVSSDYEISGCTFSGEVNITSTEKVDRLIGGTGPGFSEANAIGTISDCTFNGNITAVNGGNLYLGGIYGNNGSANVVIDGCYSTSTSSITGFTSAKSVGMIAARPNKDGFTIKNCKVAGTVTSKSGTKTTITADNIADWIFKGDGTTNAVTLTNNGFNND